ncbi:MAG: nucleoside deaminase [Actinomycetota bacterium]
MSIDQIMLDRNMLDLAIAEAEFGFARGGIPIGAVLAVGDHVLGAGHNQRVQLGSAIRHGETDALEKAGRQPAATYARATMYTTLSPCSMCTGAILLYGIPRVVIGENETFLGSEELLRANGVEVVNLRSERCVELMRTFIAAHPELWNEDIGEIDDPAAEA